MIIADNQPGGKVVPPNQEVMRMITLSELMQLMQVIIGIIGLYLNYKRNSRT